MCLSTGSVWGALDYGCFCVCMHAIDSTVCHPPERNAEQQQQQSRPHLFSPGDGVHMCVCLSVFVHMCGRGPLLHSLVRVPEMETKSPPAFITT